MNSKNVSNIEAARIELIESLSSENVNVLKVRTLCRRNPDLLSDGAKVQYSFDGQPQPLRLRVWSLLLLGPQYSPESRILSRTKGHCEEYHVLIAG